MSDNLARVIPLVPRTEPRRLSSVKARTVLPLRRRPRRQPTNGHSADCPYPNRDPQHCGICASERKGADA